MAAEVEGQTASKQQAAIHADGGKGGPVLDIRKAIMQSRHQLGPAGVRFSAIVDEETQPRPVEDVTFSTGLALTDRGSRT